MTIANIKKRMVGAFLVLALIIAALPALPVHADKIGIDNFNSVQAVDDPGTTNSAVDYASAIGGERDMWVTRTGGSLLVSADSGVLNDYLGYSQGSLTYGTLLIVWDGNDNNATTIDYTGLDSLNADLTDGGLNTGFYIDIVGDDHAATMRLTVYENASDYEYCDIPLTGVAPVTIFRAFGDACWQQVGNGTDFNDIGAISLFVDGSSAADLDLTIDWITVDDATPTAVTLGDFGAQAAGIPLGWLVVMPAAVLGGGAMLWLRRRQRMQV